MIHDNIQFHNVHQLETVPGMTGHALYRVPEQIRNQLNERARCVAKQSTGCEIRFVCDAPQIEAYLTIIQPEWGGMGKLSLFKGDYCVQSYDLEPGVFQRIRIESPEAFKHVNHEAIGKLGFSPNVWRISFDQGLGIFHGLEPHGFDYRPPTADEMPKLNWLAYGSSITHSSINGYAHIAAKRLKVDLQNKGLAGSCHLEPVMAEWLSQSCEWDFITCEMGINMRHVHTSEIFAERVENILKQLTNDHKDKPIIAINIYPNCLTEGWINPIKKDNKEAQQELAFNQIVREKVEQNKSRNLHFIEGSEILDDFTGLSGDLLHPDLYGHSLMGHNLAKILKDILQVR